MCNRRYGYTIRKKINSNMRCIEIGAARVHDAHANSINSNMRCIEIDGVLHRIIYILDKQ